MGAIDQSTDIDHLVNTSRRQDPYTPLKSEGRKQGDLSSGIRARFISNLTKTRRVETTSMKPNKLNACIVCA